MINDHVYTFFIMCPGIFLAKCIILSPSSSVLLMVSTACANKHSASNFHHYIHRGMVHRTSLKYGVTTIFALSLFMAWLTVPT